MPESIVQEAAAAPGRAACAHHWVIATPDGEMSLGKCKVCGTEKEFPNSAEDGLWQRNVPQSRWTGRADPKSLYSGY
jgi:hypothetical protein